MVHNIHIWNMEYCWNDGFFTHSESHTSPLMWLNKIYDTEFIEHLVSKNEVCQVFLMKFIAWKIRSDESRNFKVLQSAKTPKVLRIKGSGIAKFYCCKRTSPSKKQGNEKKKQTFTFPAVWQRLCLTPTTNEERLSHSLSAVSSANLAPQRKHQSHRKVFVNVLIKREKRENAFLMVSILSITIKPN